jgi:RNA 3'-terminal phosphate cyclase-like protein
MSCIMIFNNRNFREKIALSLIFRKKIKINKIRNNEVLPGIKNFELDILCLADKFSSESIIKINENGTIIDFFPGIIEKQKIEHTSTSFRSLSYYIEFIIYLILNSNKRNEIKLTGIRSGSIDISLENILYVSIPLIRRLGLRDIRFKVYSCLFSSLYNTEIIIFFPKLQTIKQFTLINVGEINKIRIINTYSKKNILAKNDIEFFLGKHIDHFGFDIKILDLKIDNQNFNFQTTTIISETNEGCVFGEDITYIFNKTKSINWNKMLIKILISLFEDIYTGTCVDKKNHIILLVKMLFNGKTNNSIARFGKLTFADIIFFRDLKKISGIIFSIKFNSSMKAFLIKQV